MFLRLVKDDLAIRKSISMRSALLDCRAEHLCDNILDKHALVDLKRIQQQSSMDLFGNKFPLRESLTDKKPRVTKIAFKSVSFSIEIQSKIGFCGVDTDIRHHAFL